MSYYTWAPIRYGVEKDDKGNITQVLVRGVGKEVSQDDLDMSDQDWNYLISVGAIREQEYPVKDLSGPSLESPREVMLREARKMIEEATMLSRQAEGREAPTGTAAERAGLTGQPATEGL